MPFHIGECMHFLLDSKSWAKGSSFGSSPVSTHIFGRPSPEKIFAEEEISEDASWRALLISRISEQGREEGEIKEQLNILIHAYEKIPLMEELIKLKLKSFEEMGGFLESFLQEAAVERKTLEICPPSKGLSASSNQIFLDCIVC